MKMETVVIRKKTELTIELRRQPRPGGAGELAAGLMAGKMAGKAAGLMAKKDVESLKPERVQEWLRAWPAWELSANGRSLHRVKTFPSTTVATRYGTFVTALAGALGQPLRLSLADGNVDLELYACRERGRFGPLTETVLDLAAQLG
jgi:hypothetical protein